MRSPYCGIRNLIALSICLCALLAFSPTLSANTTITIGEVNLGNYTPTGGVSEPVGPYPGTLVIGTTTSPNSLFFCLTGNQALTDPETGTEDPPSVAQGTMTVQQEEEAAFLASLTLTDAAADKIGITTTGSGTSKTVDLAQNGTVTIASFVSTVLGPIQTAIWDIMGTLPSGDASITDTATLNLVNEAKTEWTNVLSNPSNAFTEFLNANVQVFYPTNGCGQAFISVDAPVPEPGTLVLFGTGALLMGLGCARRLWARRRSS